jgi:hypothetical protein
VGQRWSGFVDVVDPRFGGGGGFLDFVGPRFGLKGGAFVNWEPTVIYTYTRPKNRKAVQFVLFEGRGIFKKVPDSHQVPKEFPNAFDPTCSQ